MGEREREMREDPLPFGLKQLAAAPAARSSTVAPFQLWELDPQEPTPSSATCPVAAA